MYCTVSNTPSRGLLRTALLADQQLLPERLQLHKALLGRAVVLVIRTPLRHRLLCV